MANGEHCSEVLVGAQGRMVIPASLRRALHFATGDRLVARKVGDSLVLEHREVIEKRLWDLYSKVPEQVSLVDELIAQRRMAARDEDER